jgi:predicted dehydrogenase
MVKAALIGCGGRGKAHALGLADDKRVAVVGLVDPNEEAAKALNEEHSFGARLYTDYCEMLDKERPDVVVSATWTPLHLPVFRACVESGIKAVLSEKPMAPTWGECLETSRLADESGCQLTFCHQRRFAKGNRLARKLIHEGALGEIQRMDLYSPPNMLDCGTHTFDQALSFNGESPAKWVLAAIDTSTTVRWFDVSAEGTAVGTVVFENGVRASFQFGGPDLDIWGGVRVVGSDGFLEVMWDGQFKRAVRYDDHAWNPVPEEDTHDDHMRAYVHEALDSLENGSEPELSHRKALRAAEIIFACYESVRRHQRIELPVSGFEDNPFLTMLEAGEFEPA